MPWDKYYILFHCQDCMYVAIWTASLTLPRRHKVKTYICARTMMLSDYVSSACMGEAHTTTTIQACNDFEQPKSDDSRAHCIILHPPRSKIISVNDLLEWKRRWANVLIQGTMMISQTTEISIYLHRSHQAYLQITKMHRNVLKLFFHRLHFASVTSSTLEIITGVHHLILTMSTKTFSWIATTIFFLVGRI